MNRITAFIYRHKVRCNELAKALKLVEHELAYTIGSKNILTLNNHSKDKRIVELTAALEEKTAKIIRQQTKLHKAGHLIEEYKTRIKTQKTLLLELEVRVHELEDNRK